MVRIVETQDRGILYSRHEWQITLEDQYGRAHMVVTGDTWVQAVQAAEQVFAQRMHTKGHQP